MTDPRQPTGSDRIHGRSSARPQPRIRCGHQCPGRPAAARPGGGANRHAGLADPEIDIATLGAVITDPAALADTSVNKVVAGFADPTRPARALYFSKAVVPWGDGPHYEHIGLYAYRREALERFVTLPQGVLERASGSNSCARWRKRDDDVGEPDRAGRMGVQVDTPADLERARRRSHEISFRHTGEGRNPPTAHLLRLSPFRARPAPIPISPAGMRSPRWRRCPAPSSRTPSRRCVTGRAAARDDPDRELGRRPGRRHPPSDAGFGPLIIGEHFEPVHHHLLALPGVTLAQIKSCAATSMRWARRASSSARTGSPPRSRSTPPAPRPNSPKAATPTVAAIASDLAGEIYGLQSLAANIEDADHNTTRFLVMSKTEKRRRRAVAPRSRPLSSTCATCRRRSTRRWAGLRPTRSI